MSSRKIEDCDKDLGIAWLKAKEIFLKSHPDRAQPFLTCTYRSNDEQTRLYNQGRTTPGKKVTNAKAGQSKHNLNPSHAFDIAFSLHGVIDWDNELFKMFADIIKPMGVKWGGDFKNIKDRPHFEI